MTRAAWTPGPWSHEWHKGAFHVTDSCGLDVAITCAMGDSQEHANARLIAAAPDLAEALRALLRVDVASENGRYCPDRADVQERARRMLARVESGT